MLIGLTGSAGAGKDTVHDTAARCYADIYTVVRKSFADPLYESAAAALGVTADDLRRWKRDPDVRVAVGYRPPDGPAGMATAVEITVRQYLQRYGTEAHRDIFGADFWLDNLDLHGHSGQLWFVTDVRFANEARYIREAGGFVARVLGPDDGLGREHASEHPVPDGLVDYVIHNADRDDPTMSYLEAQVLQLVRRVGRPVLP